VYFENGAWHYVVQVDAQGMAMRGTIEGEVRSVGEALDWVLREVKTP
jgi:hypothetical protein